MNRRGLVVAAGTAAVFCLLSIFLFDAPVARALAGPGGPVTNWFDGGTRLLEILFLFDFSKWAFGFVLLACGLILLIWRERRPAAWAVLFVAASQLTTRLVAGVLKNVFLRTRPSDLLASGSWDTQFFQDGGSSFPSGHAAHFWGLFFALAYLYPRYRIAFAVVPVFVSVARFAVNDHSLSDVIASAAIAAVLTLAYTYLPPVRRVVAEKERATEPLVVPQQTADEAPIGDLAI